MQLVTTAEWNLTGSTHGTLHILGYHARIRPVVGTTSLRWSVVLRTAQGLERVDDGASLDIADAQDECEESIREHHNRRHSSPQNDRDLITDERLRQVRDDENVCTSATERAIAAELLEARARIAELEAQRIGYITGYRSPDGWTVEFDGAPFTTRQEAQVDLLDAIEHSLPGLECRTLTIYDQETWNG